MNEELLRKLAEELFKIADKDSEEYAIACHNYREKLLEFEFNKLKEESE